MNLTLSYGKLFIMLIIVMTATNLPATDDPFQEMKQAITDSVKILGDAAYKGEDQKNLQREKIWDAIKSELDFVSFSTSALGRNWKMFSDEQRNVFTEEFTTLLKTTYLNQIQGSYNGESVEFLETDWLDKEKALVRTVINRQGVDIPVDYRMHQQNGKWLVYDILVEGVSLVKNYRSQFDKFLFKNKPAALTEKLKSMNQ